MIINKNKKTQINDPVGETFEECPTKPEDVIETKIPVEYKIRLNHEPDSTSAWCDFNPRTSFTTKKTFRLRKDFFTKIILLSLAIGRCATAKSIEGPSVENKIERGNLANGYFIEQSSRDIIKEKIDEETIQAFDCMEESMASAEISLNPPSECKREDASAYHKPIMKRAQVLEKVKRIPVNITTCMIQWRVNVGW